MRNGPAVGNLPQPVTINLDAAHSQLSISVANFAQQALLIANELRQLQVKVEQLEAELQAYRMAQTPESHGLHLEAKS